MAFIQKQLTLFLIYKDCKIETLVREKLKGQGPQFCFVLHILKPRQGGGFVFLSANGRIGTNKYGEYKMQFAVHKSQATTQTCRQITITGDAEIHVRGKA